MKILRCFFLFGLLVTVFGLVVNISQQKDYQFVAIEKQAVSDIVSDKDGMAFQLPFTYRLEGVISENYPSGTAKSHTAKLICQYHGKTDTLSVSENHPARFYQYDFYLCATGITKTGDTMAEFSVSQSPAQTVVYLGLVGLIFVSLGWIVRFFPSDGTAGRWILVALLVLIVIVIFLILNPMMRSKEIPPILRSVWFIPHVVSYVLSYALLLAAFLMAVHAWWKQSPSVLEWSERLMKFGTGFYTIGLALGIIWAKSAWGTFWNWDMKETLALITYGYYLLICVAAHYVPYLKHNPQIGNVGNDHFSWNLSMQFWGILFLVLCWVGPMFLPHVLDTAPSLHSY